MRLRAMAGFSCPTFRFFPAASVAGGVLWAALYALGLGACTAPPSQPVASPPDTSVVGEAMRAARSVQAGSTDRALPGVDVRVRGRPYSIHGSSVRTIGQSLRTQAPRVDGTAYHGYTRWSLTWRGDRRRSAGRVGGRTPQPGRCVLEDVRVRLTVEMTLPTWHAPSDAPSRLVRQWRAYRFRLDRHEHGHRVIGEHAAQALRQRLEGLAAPSCAQLEARGDTLRQRITRRYHRQDAAYDRRTRHGRAQGLTWPPRSRRSASTAASDTVQAP
jgi:predicted secreted Zn-dependent protease